MEKGSIFQYLAREGVPPPSLRLQMLVDVAEGLEYLPSPIPRKMQNGKWIQKTVLV